VLFLGYRLGRFLESMASNRKISLREQELFTTQKGFKTLYEQELTTQERRRCVEDSGGKLFAACRRYRKKAALRWLFASAASGPMRCTPCCWKTKPLKKRLYSQNEKLRQERTDGL